ncbi:hypothetical protein P3T25_005637 [Paraburkholderia sp. GAS32]
MDYRVSYEHSLKNAPDAHGAKLTDRSTALSE